MLVLKIILTCFLVQGSIGVALTPNPTIVIVGSGPSGIAAATKLLKNNFTNIKILEAENRIGGRINSVKFGNAFVDLGAEFCHGEKDNIVYSMVNDLGILRHSSDDFDFFLSNGTFVKNETRIKLLEFAKSLQASDEVKDDCKDVLSVGECLKIRSKNILNDCEDPEEKKILELAPDWATTYLTSYDSPFDLNDLTILSQFKICEGDNGLNWNGLGYKTILEIMMQKYPDPENQLPIDDKIFFQKEVSNISNWQNGQKIEVTTKDGSIYLADHVIFTPSVGVLKGDHHSLFNPTLPQEKIDSINNIGFGAIMKVIMHFSERWWKDDAAWTFMWTAEHKEKLKQENLEWLITTDGINQAENNPNVITVWYSGSYIPLMETLSEEEILKGQHHLINTFLAPHYNVTMPDKILRTTWYSNPHFRGTYSYESVKGNANKDKNLQKKLAKPLLNQHKNPSVLFAGEATHPYYFSTVHGAIESGYREANRLINLYQDK